MSGEENQVQAEEKALIALPHDYDARFGVEGINLEMQHLILQVLAAKDEETAAKLAEVQEEHLKRTEEFEAKVAELNDRVVASDKLHATIEALRKELHDAVENRVDAEQKRDNAVRMAEEAQEARTSAEQEAERLRGTVKSLEGQINELEGMLRAFKTSKPTGGLQLTSTLPTLSEDDKARRERERIELINRNLAAKYPDVPPLPSAEKAATGGVEEVTEEDVKEQLARVSEAAAAAERFPDVAQAEPGAEAAVGGATEADANDRAAESEAAPSVAERLAALEAWKDSVEERIAGLAFQR